MTPNSKIFNQHTGVLGIHNAYSRLNEHKLAELTSRRNEWIKMSHSLVLCAVTVTESSETSSQCTSNDSVTGLSTITIPGHSSLVLDSYNNESSSFLCSSTPPSPLTPASMFQKDEDLTPPGTKFITAVSVSSPSLSPSYTEMT